MRVRTDVNIKERNRQPLPEQSIRVFSGSGIWPEICRARFEKTQIYWRDLTVPREVAYGIRQNLGTGCDIGKEHSNRDRDGRSSGCGIVMKKGAGMWDHTPSRFQTLLSMSLLETAQLVVQMIFTMIGRPPHQGNVHYSLKSLGSVLLRPEG